MQCAGNNSTEGLTEMETQTHEKSKKRRATDKGAKYKYKPYRHYFLSVTQIHKLTIMAVPS